MSAFSRGSETCGATSASVQVFGCRHDEAIHALRRPASEKRQGTKSRSITGRGCRGRYGDFAAGLGLLRAVHVASDAGVFAIMLHALSEQAKRFYLSRGFVESPLQPMTLIMTLATVRSILAEPD